MNEWLYSPEKLSVTIQPCNVCNFRCKMCNDNKSSGGFISLDIYKKILSEMLTNNMQLLHLTGPWGEPMLHPQFDILVKEAVARNIDITITTNGSLLTKEKIDFLFESRITQLSVSFSGHNDETYNNVYSGKFSKISAAMHDINKRLKDSHAPFNFNVRGVICDMPNMSIQDQANATYEYLQRLGFHDRNITITTKYNRGGRHTSETLQMAYPEREFDFCPAFLFIGFLWNGVSTLCHCCDHEGILSIGSIQDKSIQELLNQKQRRDWLAAFTPRDVKTIPLCCDCDMKYGHSGGITEIPVGAHAWILKARELHQQNRYHESLAAFSQAIDINPDIGIPGLIFAERGNVLLAMGRAVEARKDYTKAFTINPRLGIHNPTERRLHFELSSVKRLIKSAIQKYCH